jgi:hypothetical protein
LLVAMAATRASGRACRRAPDREGSGRQKGRQSRRLAGLVGSEPCFRIGIFSPGV